MAGRGNFCQPLLFISLPLIHLLPTWSILIFQYGSTRGWRRYRRDFDTVAVNLHYFTGLPASHLVLLYFSVRCKQRIWEAQTTVVADTANSHHTTGLSVPILVFSAKWGRAELSLLLLAHLTVSCSFLQIFLLSSKLPIVFEAIFIN